MKSTVGSVMLEGTGMREVFLDSWAGEGLGGGSQAGQEFTDLKKVHSRGWRSPLPTVAMVLGPEVLSR